MLLLNDCGFTFHYKTTCITGVNKTLIYMHLFVSFKLQNKSELLNVLKRGHFFITYIWV